MSDTPADPKAAQLKYTYPDAAKDDAAVTKVETAIASHFPDSYAEGLKESTNNAPIKESEVQAKKKEAEEKANEEAKSNPDKVKKEATESPPGKLDTGAAVKPQVKAGGAAKGGPKEPQKGAGEGAPKKSGATGAPGKGGAEGAPKPPQQLVLQAAASGDGNIDKFLNDYPTKSPETMERLSKIKEMASVAKGFDGQIEGVVANGDGPLASAKAGITGFLGKKEMGAIFGENPYAKVQGGLGKLMRGLSVFQNVVSIVGNVCTKLGLVLTIVGLLGMIFPPLGAAVSAVARILNVVGIICDVLGLALSGVLTGLNGVVLAKQIAKGASNEEKAATADAMVTEATSASGHVMALAMAWGPGFMKGFKSASKGVIGNLFAKFKSVVGKFATKALGPVANWAKNIGFKLGIGLEKEVAGAAPGVMSKIAGGAKKAWNMPGKALEKLRDTSFVKKMNTSSFAKGAEKFAAKVDSNGFANFMEGQSAGKLVGGAGAGKSWSTKLEKSAEEDAKIAAQAAEKNAAANAGNQEREKIERDIRAKQKVGNSEYEKGTAGGHGVSDESAIGKSNKAYAEADELKAGEKDAVAKAEKEGGKEAKAETKKAAQEAKADEKKEDQEKDRIESFKKDPKRFSSETQGLETRRTNIEAKAHAPGLADEEKKKLEEQAEKLAKTIDERRLIPLKASGGEAPENLLELGKQGKEAWEAAHGKDEKSEKLEQYKKVVEKDSGHEASEKFERGERHEKIEEFEQHAAPAQTTSQQVEGMLSGLDEDHEDEKHEDEGDEGGSDEPHPDEANAHSNEPQQDEKKTDPDQSAGPAQSPDNKKEETAQQPGGGGEEKKEEKAEVPELIYWPKLTGAGGEFTKAAADLMQMKRIAFAFHKSQLEAKKKAMETVATLAKSGEDAGKKQGDTQAHAGSLHGTIDEANKAAGSADKGSAAGADGSKSQGDGKGNSNGKAEQSPDPGEKPSLWHPIKRIWWYVKKWASEKAAAVFGWIQDKIASLILQGLCGVSMDDMRAYTGALHNRMQFSKLAGTQGVDAANKAMGEQAKTKTESKSYSDQAMDDAKECDQNIADADTFVKTVEDTEKDLVAEQAKAAVFLTELKSAVDAEKARKAAEKAKAAAAAATAASANTNGPPPPNAPGPAASGPKPKKKKKEPKKQEVSATQVTKVTGAANFVVSQANLIVTQLTTQKTEQSARLKASAAKKKGAKGYVDQLHVGDKVVATMRDHTSEVVGSMDAIRSQTPANMGALKGMASQVKSQAKQLDDTASSAFQSLNFAFKSTYEAISHMGK